MGGGGGGEEGLVVTFVLYIFYPCTQPPREDHQGLYYWAEIIRDHAHVHTHTRARSPPPPPPPTHTVCAMPTTGY